MDKSHNLIVGSLGEDVARRYLKRKGYRIVEQNYRTRYAEIDLIVQKKKLLVFVEVRAKIGERFGTPEDTLDRRKINKFRRNCLAYISQKGWRKDYRMDAICIVLKENKDLERVSHYQDILF